MRQSGPYSTEALITMTHLNRREFSEEVEMQIEPMTSYLGSFIITPYIGPKRTRQVRGVPSALLETLLHPHGHK